MAQTRSEVVAVTVKMRRPDGTETTFTVEDPKELAQVAGLFWGEQGKSMLEEYYRLKGMAEKAKGLEAAWNGEPGAMAQGRFAAEGAEAGLPGLLVKDVRCYSSPRG